MKRATIVVMLACLLAFCVCFAACDTDCKNGNHDWDEGVVTVEATCIKEGVKTFTCSKCGETKQEQIPLAAHTIELVQAKDAEDCATPGCTAHYECKVCGKAFNDAQGTEELDKDSVSVYIPHSMKRVNPVDPACGVEGNIGYFACEKCGFMAEDLKGTRPLTKEDVTIAALEHKFTAYEKQDPTCGDDGWVAHVECEYCHKLFTDETCAEELTAETVAIPATGEHVFSNDSWYFVWQQCAVCGQNIRLESLNTYEEDFVYDFDDEKKAEIEARYQLLLDAMGGKEDLSNEEFCTLFEEYDDDITYIRSQYQFAKIFFDIDYNNLEQRNIYVEMSDYFNTSVARYYTLFRQVDESKYAAFFWEYEEFTDEDKKAVFALADSYDLDNQNAADEIANDYDLLMDSLEYSLDNASEEELLQIFELYSKFVDANNGIAKTAGYNNYMEYAYENIYERDYKPEDVEQMRNYVKQYIGPILADFADVYMNFPGWSSEDQQIYYTRYVGVSVFAQYTNELGVQLSRELSEELYAYFGELSNAEKGINFAETADELFKNGNYFTGDNKSAYTWYIYSKDVPIMYFGEDYDEAFTFVHEFGHYFEFVYNDRLSLSMDHDETQSQGDEMLFLAWLKKNLPEGMDEGFNILESGQFLDILGTIALSTAVDEFEQLVYTGATEYNGQPIPTVTTADETTVINYQELFETILTSYWEDIGEVFYLDYWAKVCVDNPGYYISYSMSALPSIEIYAKANTEGFDAARDSYLKLFTFADEEQFVETDEYGYAYVKEDVTYQSILNWAGLSGPFQEELYKTIQQAFAKE